MNDAKKLDARVIARAIETESNKALYLLDGDNDNDWCARMVHAATGTEILVSARTQHAGRIEFSIAYLSHRFTSDQGGTDHRTYYANGLRAAERPDEATSCTVAADRPIAAIAKRAVRFAQAMAPTWGYMIAQRASDIAFQDRRDKLRAEVGALLGKHSGRGSWWEQSVSITVSGHSIKIDCTVSLDELRTLIEGRKARGDCEEAA